VKTPNRSTETDWKGQGPLREHGNKACMEKPPFDIQVLSDNSAEKNQARKTGLACMKQEGT